jgi:hypothetical protein
VDGDDKGGGQPPGEGDSFDISRRGKTAVAAEVAARMARFRAARARKGVSASSPGAEAVPVPPPPAPPPAATPLSAALLPQPSTMVVNRIDRALRSALQVRPMQDGNIWVPSLQRASSNGTAFQSLLAEGPNMNAIGMRRERRAPLPALDALLPSRSPIRTAKRQLPVVAWRPTAASLDRSLSRAGARIATACSAGAERGTRIIRTAAPVLQERIAAMRRRFRSIGAAARYAASDRLVASALAAIAVAIVAWFLVSFDRPVAHLGDAASVRDNARDDATDLATAPQPIGGASAATEPTPKADHLAARLKPQLPWPSLAVRLKPADAATPPGQGQAPQKRGDPRAADSVIKQMFGAGQGLSRQPPQPPA